MRYDIERQSDDEGHLRLLAIFYYISGGLSGLCAFFPVIHLTIGIAMVSGAFDDQMKGAQGGPPMETVGWFFIIIASVIMLFGWMYAIGMIVAGRKLQRRKGYMYCMVMAGIACSQMPLGTILGVFTFLVLLRPSVKEMFGRPGKVVVQPGVSPPSLPRDEDHPHGIREG